ncbi:Crp/Fnr family transcriptional regulator [Psychroserpens sp.]|uniref:Crp/Fnr family transcriptional regulator n=1 Tax=Psychroserpens sp. TaxID=2020870 RepID=UPI001B062C0D|nr:Crp/Fnr family transcriptional regulator [Psychroserpens sp.]MBO6607020.1 Crp/Fnr family transcriptional regulator [Psychroserpens sp.]MBO6654166.1 Crp/Fnr family transcriptional regulator [Psychroserpens sp.]MBO6682548.1 Crp/Fnr family transcriptional regulator [Psychroserpens sp.]MBO6750792.1 Crp/Fnr family transcriptional regulator [Psychroserpens sp.]MBO6915779.1 Crp/Fnr family transcriptional regulator [Psychroserpens sp.]
MSRCEQCIIREFNTLKALTKEELIRISGCKTSKTVKKGEIIFEEGDTLNGVYCVKDGICKMSKLSANGKDQIVKLIVKGDLMGKNSIIREESANLTAVALNDMEVCFIPKQEIMNDLKKNPNFSMEVLKKMTNDLKTSENIIVNMAQKSVKQRLADLLIYIHDSFGVDENGFLKIVLSREDYANVVGTATESAIRILSQFKKAGYISTEGKQIKIERIQKLKLIE